MFISSLLLFSIFALFFDMDLLLVCYFLLLFVMFGYGVCY